MTSAQRYAKHRSRAKKKKSTVDELEEWIRVLRATVQLKEFQKQTNIEVHNKVLLEYNKDLAFNLTILYKFGVREEQG
jgi:hypothetical protein